MTLITPTRRQVISALALAPVAPAWLARATQAAPASPVVFSDTSRLGRPFAKDPSVVRFRGRYLMYYSLPPGQEKKDPETGWPIGWGIGVAESRDLVNWRKVAEVLPQQEVEKNGICAPGAIVMGDRVHLFYQTYGNGPRDAICHGSSADGLRFARHPQNPVYRPTGMSWSVGRAIDAEPFVHDGRLLLYYATRDPAMKRQIIGVAEAGLESGFGPKAWRDLSQAGPILEPTLPWERECVEAPAVLRRGGRLFMFYAGGYNNEPQQIGVAASEDGVRWTRLSRTPFLPNGAPGSWNSSESGHPGVLQDGDRTYLFYQGNPDRGHTWSIAMTPVGWGKDGPKLAARSVT